MTIDPTSTRSTREQVADYFRYEIGLGRQYKIGDILPSTRIVARQAGVSYHTIRNAYRLLEEEGLLAGETGSGFRVIARTQLDPSERLERGAALVSDAIRKMISLGLDESDIEYIVEEQLSIMPLSQSEHKILVVGPYQEYAAGMAAAIKDELLVNVEHCVPAEIEQHADADYVILPVQLFRKLGFSFTHAEVITIDTRLPVEALESVAKLLDYESLGLLTRFTDSIGPLTKIIKDTTGFQGQIIASTTDTTKGARVDTFVSQVDVLLFTPATRRIVFRHVEKDTPVYSIAELPTQESLKKIRESLPD